MNSANEKLACTILFRCPDTGEELRPSEAPSQDDDGNLVIIVSNRQGTTKWKNTIISEEV
jgi:hypothetical protein